MKPKITQKACLKLIKSIYNFMIRENTYRTLSNYVKGTFLTLGKLELVRSNPSVFVDFIRSREIFPLFSYHIDSPIL